MEKSIKRKIFKAPKTVIIFGNTLKVIMVDDLKDDLGNQCLGLYDPENSAIFLDKNQPDNEMLHTFIHELGHALFNRTSMVHASIPVSIEEIIVNNFATMVTEVFNIKLKKKEKIESCK